MNLVTKYLTIGALVTAVFSDCDNNILMKNSVMEKNMAEANGYTVLVHYFYDKNSIAEIKIGDYVDSRHEFSQLIYAVERNGDDRIDEIKLLAPKGSPLEELASISRIEKIFQEFQRKHPRKQY